MKMVSNERLLLISGAAVLALLLVARAYMGSPGAVAPAAPAAAVAAAASVAREPSGAGATGGIRAIGVDKPFEVELGEIRSIACGLVNATGRPLEIASISTGCACRTASFQPKTIGQGETTTVEIVYDSSHSAAIDLQFPIVITLADGKTITADKEIKIDHAESIRLQGAPLDLGDVPLASTASGEMSIEIPASDPITGVSARSGIEGLAVRVAESPDKPGRYTISCALAAPDVAREIQGIVRVEVAGYRGRDVVYEVPVRGRVVGGVTIHPPTAFVGMLMPGKTKTLRFDIAARGEPRAVTIERVTAPAWAGASHACFAGKSAVVLDVTFATSEPPADLRQFDLELSGTVDGRPFSPVVPCLAVAITAAP